MTKLSTYKLSFVQPTRLGEAVMTSSQTVWIMIGLAFIGNGVFGWVYGPDDIKTTIETWASVICGLLVFNMDA